MSRYDSKESHGGVASVRTSSRGLSHPRELVWRLSSQGRLGYPKSGHGCPGSSHGYPGGMELVFGLHQECPRVVKLVMGLHHVNQGSNQGEFRDGGLMYGFHHMSSGGEQGKFLTGGASAWALL